MDEPLAWEVLESNYLSRKPWLTIRQDRVRLPRGAVIEEYFVLEYPPWANVVAITSDERVVLVRQYRHGLGRVCIGLPSGVVDPGDSSPESAARRELLEETGYGGGDWVSLCVASANPSTHSNLTHSFLAIGVRKIASPAPEETEDVHVSLASVDEVIRLLNEGQVVQASHLAPLLKFLLTRAKDKHFGAD